MKVKTRTGIVSGKTLENGVEAFLGIPYAKQPVGDLRWRAPERLDDSDEEIECVEFGHSARQFIDEVELASLHEQGEDCLSLNVWVRGHTHARTFLSWYISMVVPTSQVDLPTRYITAPILRQRRMSLLFRLTTV